MYIKTRAFSDGTFKVVASEKGVTCSARLPQSRDALSLAVTSCYQIIETLEGIEAQSYTSGCSGCDEV